MIFWNDGQIIEQNNPESYNFSLQYSGGTWEGIRCYDRHLYTGEESDKGKYNILFLEKHIKRMLNGCRFIGWDCQYSSEEIQEAIHQLVSKFDQKNLYIRPIVYINDSAERITKHNGTTTLKIFATSVPVSTVGNNIKKVMISSHIRSYPQNHMQCKNSSNYFIGQLAIKTAQLHNYDDAFLMDKNGYINELIVSNFALYKDGKWYTPPNDGSILPGITRSWFIENYEVEEKYITRHDLYTAECIIALGTFAEVAFIEKLDNITGYNKKLYEDVHKKYVEFIHKTG